jgi:hypothetical protein
MTRPSTLAALVEAGLLQRKPPDVRRVAGWLARSRKDFDLAGEVLAGIDRDRRMAVGTRLAIAAVPVFSIWRATG